MKIKSLKKLSTNAKHNAFTDLCVFKTSLYCCFRQASNHVSSDGLIRINILNVAGENSSNSFIKMANTDLRDPKLTVSPDGKLILLAYARYFADNGQRLITQNLCWVSQDGLSWSAPRVVGPNYWWLWRIRWRAYTAYGFAYNRQANAIDFYQGDPRRTFNKIVTGALSLQKHQLGYPNESDLVFIDKHCYALVRRDADTYTAQLGRSCYPFKRWVWQDLDFYLGGPVMQLLDKQSALVAGRIIHQQQLKTAIFKLNLVTGVASEKLLLPSGGDNSYPGMIIIGRQVYLSYYSSHQAPQQDCKSAVYLAQISL
ncbi:hypothetical protein [Paraglaciecola sp.]|uniref:hypothetical protein n=1 Tax=Paraglaciecola sp. TaxID=1920173 RepID=UPI0030F4B01D